MAADRNLGPNQGLVGEPGSRNRLSTPALILDLDRMERNLKTMASVCEARGVGLRPHAKAHKSLHIAKMQVAAGALGICCATLGEAEAIAPAVAGTLITSPMTSDAKIGRLLALNARSTDLMTVVDNREHAVRLDAAAGRHGKPLKVLVDMDIGQRRTGVVSVEAAADLAQSIAGLSTLELVGVQAYAGHIQHLPDYRERAAASRENAEAVRAAVEHLRRSGLGIAIVTGAGTGSCETDAATGIYTELQAGSYLFMDAQYDEVPITGADAHPFQTALFVQASVVSANHQGQATTDGGTKSFATDGPAPVIARGAPAGASYRFSGDEFGCVVLPAPGEPLSIGAPVECVVPHCDTTVNLHNFYHCVRGDTLVDIWPIDARGRY